MKNTQAQIVAEQFRQAPHPGSAQLVHVIGSLTDALSSIKDIKGGTPEHMNAIQDLRNSLQDAITHAAAAISSSVGGRALTEAQIKILTGINP